MDRKFAEQKSYINVGFGKTFEQIDTVESNLTKKIDTVETNLTKKIDGVAQDVKSLRQFTVEGFEGMEKYIDATKKEMVTEIVSEIKGHIDLVMKK